MSHPNDPAHPAFYRKQHQNQFIQSLVYALRGKHLIVPDYQRARVWTREQSEKWCGYVLSGAPLPSVMIREVNALDGSIRDELVDGQQRLAAIVNWLDGKIAAETWDGRRVTREHISARRMLRLTIPVVAFPVGTSREDAITAYLAVNSGGTPHTADELARVRRMLGGASSDGDEGGTS